MRGSSDTTLALLALSYYAVLFFIDTLGIRVLARHLRSRQLLGWWPTLALLALVVLDLVLLLMPAFIAGWAGRDWRAGVAACLIFLGVYLLFGAVGEAVRGHGAVFYPALRPHSIPAYILLPLGEAAGFTLVTHLGGAWQKRRSRLHRLRARRGRAVG